MATIKEFTTAVRATGLARTNRYSVLFTVPMVLNPEVNRKALMFCDQIQLPGTNFSTTQNRTFGEFREAPYEKLYEHINLSFYVDKNMQVKDLFDKWSEFIYNPQTRVFNYYDNYVTDMLIKVEDVGENNHYFVKLHECYPKSIGAVQMDYASKDVMKLSVSMAYKWFETQAEATQGDVDMIKEQTWADKLKYKVTGAVGAAVVSKVLPKIHF